MVLTIVLAELGKFVISNLPSMSVTVPIDVPSTNIVAPIIGSPSSADFTMPVTREKFYFIFGDKIVEATRKEVGKSLGDSGKTKLKAFVKQNKIKWKEEASLVKLLGFFHQ